MEKIQIDRKFRAANDYKNQTMTQSAPPLVPPRYGGASTQMQKKGKNDEDEEPLLGFYYLNIVVYSQDRPFSLQQFLSSLHSNLLGQKSAKQVALNGKDGFAQGANGQPLKIIELSATLWVSVQVLYSTPSNDSELLDFYHQVHAEFPWANMVPDNQNNE